MINIEKILSELGGDYLLDFQNWVNDCEYVDLDLFREVFNILDNSFLCGVDVVGNRSNLLFVNILAEEYPLYTKTLTIVPEMWDIYKKKLRAKKLKNLAKNLEN